MKSGKKAAWSAGLVAMLAGAVPLLAAPPAALDRVPPDAAVAIGLRSISQTMDKVQGVMGVFGGGAGLGGIEELQGIVGTPGLNKDGSLALAIMIGPEGFDESAEAPPAVAIIPVSDYAAFLKALGGSGEGIAEVAVDGETNFLKDIGGGYAALSQDKALLEGFAGTGGHAEKHLSAIGPTGRGIADGADVVIVTNVPALEKPLSEGVSGMAEQFQGMMMMMGPQAEQAEAGFKMIQMVAGNWVRDAERAIVGIRSTDVGLGLDIATHFKKDSELAGMFTGKGNATRLLGRLPSQPFFFAGAIDTSLPGMKKIGEGFAALQGGQGGANPFGDLLKASGNVDGFAFGVGANPAAMMGGGLFTNTTTFVSTSDGAGYVAATRKMMEDASKVQQGPVKVTSTYEVGAVEIKGVKADRWSSKVQVDPNDPTAMQTQMMMSMMYGPAGMGGFNAVVDGGVVTSMGANTPLMEMAIDAAREGKGLGTDASITGVQALLPADRVFEVYVGSKALFDAVGGFAAMMGGGGGFVVPAKLTPVAIAGAVQEGGINIHILIPHDVIKAGMDLQAAMQPQGMEDEPMQDDGGDGAAPRF